MPTRDTWWDRAACKDADPGIFTTTQDGGCALNNFEEARKLCKGCPVRTDCLTDALTSPPTWVHSEIEGSHSVITATGFSMFQAGLTPSELNQLYRRGQQ